MAFAASLAVSVGTVSLIGLPLLAAADPPSRIFPGRYPCAALSLQGQYGAIVDARGLAYGWEARPAFLPSALTALVIDMQGGYRFETGLGAVGTVTYDSRSNSLSATGPMAGFVLATYAPAADQFDIVIDAEGPGHICSLNWGSVAPDETPGDAGFQRHAGSEIAAGYDFVAGDGASAAMIAGFDARVVQGGGRPDLLTDVWAQAFSDLLALREGAAYRPSSQGLAEARSHLADWFFQSAYWPTAPNLVRQTGADRLILRVAHLQAALPGMTAGEAAAEADHLLRLMFVAEEIPVLEALLRGG